MMKRFATMLLAAFMLMQMLACAAAADDSGEMNAADIFETCVESVVHIETSSGGGTGFFVTENTIATNWHVIDGAEWITVKNVDGWVYNVTTILGSSSRPDLALLRIEETGKPVTMSHRKLREGDPLYCIGAPMGIYPCISNGIVMKRSHVDADVDYILSNFHSIGGNSGGPVFNAYGEVVGVVVGGYMDGPNAIDMVINARYLSTLDTGSPRKISTKSEWQREMNRPDEERYERAALKDAQVGQLVSFGRYEQDDNRVNGKEDILWLVTERNGSELKLMSLYCLDVVQYHTERTDVTWETSHVRAFLNGEFYNNAFNADERAKIMDSHVVNQDNVVHGTPGGNDTVDKVYLLSLEEAMAFYDVDTPEERFYDHIYVQATEYTMSKGVWLEIPGSNRCWMWLRSSGGNPQRAAEIGSRGYLSFNGGDVDAMDHAVRPVIRIRVK